MNVFGSLLYKLKSYVNYKQYKQIVIDEREKEIQEAIEEARESMYVLRRLLVDVYGRR